VVNAKKKIQKVILGTVKDIQSWKDNMARTIGKVNIRKLKAIVQAAMTHDGQRTTEEIMERVPAAWFNTWEGAWYEITNIIDDERMKG